MASNIKILRRLGGAAGSPPAAQAIEGVLAANIPGAAGGTAKPTLYLGDGSAWRTINPSATVGAATIALQGTPAAGSGTGIGAGWTALTTKPTEDIVVATYNGGAWMKTGAGGADGDWTSLGSAASITYATAAEVLAGTSTTTVINPKIFRDYTLVAPTTTPTNDANHVPRLNASGLLDVGFLPISTLRIKGSVDPTAAVPAGTHVNGEFYFASAAGAPHASWGVGTTAIAIGDVLIYDGAAWHAVDANLDPSAYLLLSGGTMTNAAAITFAVPTGAAPTNPTVRLDGGDRTKSSIDNFTLDAGTY